MNPYNTVWLPLSRKAVMLGVLVAIATGGSYSRCGIDHHGRGFKCNLGEGGGREGGNKYSTGQVIAEQKAKCNFGRQIFSFAIIEDTNLCT